MPRSRRGVCGHRLHRSKRWSVRLIRGKRAEPLGRTGKSAEDEAITKFKLNEQQRKRLLHQYASLDPKPH